MTALQRVNLLQHALLLLRKLGDGFVRAVGRRGNGLVGLDELCRDAFSIAAVNTLRLSTGSRLVLTGSLSYGLFKLLLRCD